LFAGSDRGGERAAAMYTLIGTGNSTTSIRRVGSPTVLRRINDHPASRLDELLPWNWKGRSARLVA
jgi:transposase